MDCFQIYFDICLTRASGQSHAAFFGFAEFIGAFALLAIVFTIADVQYRFRASVSPLSLPKITFWAIGIIGFGTLATDIWVVQDWPVIFMPHITYGVIQGLFAAGFLMVAMMWLWVAFIKPPIFSKWNSRKYGEVLFDYLLRGSEAELPVIAVELNRSADSLVSTFEKYRTDLYEQLKKRKQGENFSINPGNYAADIMRLIGNRKFSRHVISSSPGTAIRIFQALIDREVYDAPIGQFAKNLSTEAILNPDSNLYHEDSQFQSGLFGEIKPFTRSIYGSYLLVEALGNQVSSPLDVDPEITRNWTAPRLEVYARAVLTTYKNRLAMGRWDENSYSLARAFSNLKEAIFDINRFDGVENGNSDVGDRLCVCVRFVSDLIKALENYEGDIAIEKFKPNSNRFDRDIYDRVAELMSEIIFSVSAVKEPSWRSWYFQYSSVWSNFFFSGKVSKTRRVIVFKLRRLIYNEIIDLDRCKKFKSFKSARYLAICLNCMGLQLGAKQHRVRGSEPLKKAILEWMRKNYLALYDSHPTVAQACLVGEIHYDSNKFRLVRIHKSHPDEMPLEEVLPLDKR